MVADSILGKVYGVWLNSAVFAFLYSIYAPFRRAWPNSAVVRFFHRDSLWERAYANSFLDRIISGVCDLLLRLIGGVKKALSPAWDGSLIVRLCSGSRILNLEFLLCAFVFLMFVIPHGFWSNPLALAAAVGFAFIYLVLAGCGKRKLMYPRELGLPFLLFAVACVVSLIFTTALGDSLRVLSFFITALLFTWVVASELSDRDKLMRFMGYIYAAVLLTALYAVAQRFMGVEVSASFTDLDLNVGVPGRVYSTLDNPNNYAEFIVLFAPLSVAYAMNARNEKLRLPLFLGLAVPMLAILMTYSRSSWLGIALAAFVFCYYSNKKLVPLMFVACIMLIPFLPDSVMTRLGTIFNTRDSSASHRLITWQCVLELLGDDGHWLTGIGMGPLVFSEIFPDYAIKAATRGVHHSQMLYMELMLETGLLGFVSFLWMMGHNIKEGGLAIYRSRDKEIKAALIGCCSAFIGIAITCVFEYIWFYPRILFAFFILLGVLLAALRMTPKNEAIS